MLGPFVESTKDPLACGIPCTVFLREGSSKLPTAHLSGGQGGRRVSSFASPAWLTPMLRLARHSGHPGHLGHPGDSCLKPTTGLLFSILWTIPEGFGRRVSF